MTTIDNIYAAINPIPAMLSAKGKVTPSVEMFIAANASISVHMSWKRYGAERDWERDFELFTGDTFDQALAKALTFVRDLPSAEDARLHAFMDKLGKLIDVGHAEGVAVDYMNPLLDTMKRLSENVITYKPTF